MEYVIYTDESDRDGKYFSNFYGGVLVRSPDLAGVIQRLEDSKRNANLFREIKWQKVTVNYLDKYKSVMDAFFDEVTRGPRQDPDHVHQQSVHRSGTLG